MRVITQSGKEMEFKSFGFATRSGDTRCYITGNVESPQPGSVYDVGRYTIAGYKNNYVAVRVLSELLQHEGKEPYKLPPETYDKEVGGVDRI